MTYTITGLQREQFGRYFEMSDEELSESRARREFASANVGFPCRVSLRDADEGEELLLIHHVNHAVETPYRAAFAIYVRRAALEAARFVDEVPPVLQGRPIAMRGYDSAGNLSNADLAMPGQADETLRRMFESPQIAYVDAHNAAHGCFAARAMRHD